MTGGPSRMARLSGSRQIASSSLTMSERIHSHISSRTRVARIKATKSPTAIAVRTRPSTPAKLPLWRSYFLASSRW